jgi:hypothetical protein
VDLVIHAEVIKFRNNLKASNNLYKGLYITETEVNKLLEEKTIGDYWIRKN